MDGIKDKEFFFQELFFFYLGSQFNQYYFCWLSKLNFSESTGCQSSCSSTLSWQVSDAWMPRAITSHNQVQLHIQNSINILKPMCCSKFILPVSECWLCVAHWASGWQLLCNLNPNGIFKVTGKHQSVPSISGLKGRKVSTHIYTKKYLHHGYATLLHLLQWWETSSHLIEESVKKMSRLLYVSLDNGDHKTSTCTSNNRSFHSLISRSDVTDVICLKSLVSWTWLS